MSSALTPEQMKTLDDVSDRLGALYQRFGRLQDRWRLKDPDVTKIMDELVELDEAVCNATDRRARLERERG
jgi:hypothetical protein